MTKSRLIRADKEFIDMLNRWKPDVSKPKQTSALAKEIEKLIYGKK